MRVMLLEITDFHEWWLSMMSIFLFTEVQQWAMLVLGMGDPFCILLVSLMALQLVLVDRNPFPPCNFTPYSLDDT